MYVDNKMVDTFKDKYNRRYGFSKGSSHSVADIAKTTGYKRGGLDTIIQKGMGAFFNNPQSVRPTVKSPQQWSKARLYSAVMGGRASKVDAKQLVKS